MAESQEELERRVLRGLQQVVGPATLPAVYLCVLMLQPQGLGEWLRVLTLAGIFVVTVALGTLRLVVRRAFRAAMAPARASEPGARLERLLTLPRRIEIWNHALSVGGAALVLIGACLWIGRSLWVVLPCLLVATCYAVLGGVWISLGVEDALRPEVLKEFQAHPTDRPRRSGYLWRRQSWFWVYIFAISLCTMLVSTSVVVATRLLPILRADAAEQQLLLRQPATLLNLGLPLLVVLGLLVGLSLLIAGRVARYQTTGTEALARSILAFADGKPALPDWIATDEIGDLSFALAAVFTRFKALGESLHTSANRLVTSTDGLRTTVQAQIKVLDSVSPVLVEAIYSTTHIRRATADATEQIQTVMAGSHQAGELGREGERALERTAEELEAIREQVSEMAAKTRSLEGQVREILSVTEVVKQLADQSNLLALNAAVEAVRAGSQGRGFSVVAREIRSLADQSIESTRRVREILDDLAHAASATAQLTEEGHGRVQVSLAQVRGSGQSLAELLRVVQGSGEAARSVGEVMDGQTGRVGEMASAVKSLAGVMQGTLKELSAIDGARQELAEVAAEVRRVVERYGLSADG